MEKFAKQILTNIKKPNVQHWPDNWGLKLLSLLFAVFLWYFVVGEDRVDVKLIIPIEIVNLPRDLVISNEYKKQLDVTIRGPRVLTRGLDKQHITRSFDLSDATPGKLVFTNTPDSVPFPRGIKVLRIQPKNITLLIDQLVQKEIAIKPTTKGNPSEGFEIVNVLIEPPTISVTGPQEVLAKENIVTTEPIDVSNLQSTTEKEISLDLQPDLAELIGEPVVTAKLVIKEKTTERWIKKVPIEFTYDAEKTTFKVIPQSVDIRAAVPISVINNKVDLNSLFTARVNAESLPPGRHLVNVEVMPPERFNILEISPKSVTIKISDTKPIKKRKPTP